MLSTWYKVKKVIMGSLIKASAHEVVSTIFTTKPLTEYKFVSFVIMCLHVLEISKVNLLVFSSIFIALTNKDFSYIIELYQIGF